jgi:hypothetical protein
MISSLARVFECNADEKEVLSLRENLMGKDYPAYIHTLFESVSLSGLMIDIGLQKSLVGFKDFEKNINQDVWYVFRSETVVDTLWAKRVDPSEGLEFYRDAVLNALKTLPAVALKTIIGYRTGLRVNPDTTASQVKRKMDEKSYRDLFFLETARICRENNIPFHIHAAFGESNIDVRENNPLHLKPFFDSPLGKEIDTVLIHGGYPYAFEAGYLASVFPRVYIDVSEFIPFATLGGKRGLEDIMSMCPLNKIMYGSDGFDIPEIHWLGALVAKQEVSSILGELISASTIDKEFGEDFARKFFYETTANLHGLRMNKE